MFRLVDAKWGPQAIDRFASYYNSLLPRFNSKFASPGCTGVDALVQDWSGEGNRVCPPVGLVVNAVQSSFGLSWSWDFDYSGMAILLLASFIVMDLHGLSRSSGRFLCFPPNTISFWKAETRCRSISLTLPFFAVAQNSECWLCVWILGKFLVVLRIVFRT